MKFSSKVQKCNLSPIRKFYPYQVEAKKRGTKIYHLNIGQPDIETPQAYFDAIRNFQQPVLEYAPSPGIPEMIEAVKKYYSTLSWRQATLSSQRAAAKHSPSCSTASWTMAMKSSFQNLSIQIITLLCVRLARPSAR